MADVDRICAATEHAIAAMQAHRDAGPTIMVETAPIYFPSRPAAPTPEYLRPGFGEKVRETLTAMRTP
ncbi:hypothetical protein ABZT49_06190 [Methylobacterium sp. EM32]|uniref:hypothetical protein n=1 Tax=Methylobacterium sp. EM32 TaxID=3163481 RepID=UPI0033BAFE5E